MRKNITHGAGFFLGFIFLFTLYVFPVQAGGTAPPDFSITSTVQHPQTAAFVENLGPNDSKYHPGQIITLRLILHNSGTQALQSISIQDTLPTINGQPVIDFMSGPGTYVPVKHLLMFSVGDLAAGESKSFELKGKIVHAALLPANQTTICLQPGNVVTAQAGTTVKTAHSSFCIERQVETKQTPPTGPEAWILTNSLLLGSLGSGYILRRKAASRS